MPTPSNAAHGLSHAKKRGRETRSAPRVIHRASVRTVLATLHLRNWRRIWFCQRSHPRLVRFVIELGLSPEPSQQPERLGRMRFLRNWIIRVGQVSKMNGIRGTGFHAGRNVIGGIDFPPSCGSRFFFRRMPACMAEVAL